MKKLCERLQQLKQEQNLRQKDIAEEVGIPLRTYQRYEYGERQPTADVLVALADYFNVSIDYIVGRTNNPNIYR